MQIGPTTLLSLTGYYGKSRVFVGKLLQPVVRADESNARRERQFGSPGFPLKPVNSRRRKSRTSGDPWLLCGFSPISLKSRSGQALVPQPLGPSGWQWTAPPTPAQNSSASNSAQRILRGRNLLPSRNLPLRSSVFSPIRLLGRQAADIRSGGTSREQGAQRRRADEVAWRGGRPWR